MNENAHAVPKDVGCDSMGRYVSRDMEGYSGHYPEWMPPYYGGRY